MTREYFLLGGDTVYRTDGLAAQWWSPEHGWLRSVRDPRMQIGFVAVSIWRAHFVMLRRWWRG